MFLLQGDVEKAFGKLYIITMFFKINKIKDSSMRKKSTVPKYEGKDLEHYNDLIAAAEKVRTQMNYHASEALDCSNADKRGVTTHMADVSSDNSRHEMEIRMLSEDGDVLRLIDDALKRLENGEYGKCQDCGEDIPEGRLKVRPYAVFCIKCKSKHEEMMRG